jgi:hypothetical protein
LTIYHWVDLTARGSCSIAACVEAKHFCHFEHSHWQEQRRVLSSETLVKQRAETRKRAAHQLSWLPWLPNCQTGPPNKDKLSVFALHFHEPNRQWREEPTSDSTSTLGLRLRWFLEPCQTSPKSALLVVSHTRARNFGDVPPYLQCTTHTSTLQDQNALSSNADRCFQIRKPPFFREARLGQ